MSHGFPEVTSERQVFSHDPAVTSMVSMAGNIHKISLSYNKTIVDLCFGRHEVLLNY